MADPVLKVLIADDEEDILAITVKRLKAAGFDVIDAANGVEALHKAMTEKPDVLVLDVNMPQKDGFEVLKCFRESPPDKKWRPVIMLSAQNEIGSYRQGFALEADHYLSKPCSIDDLVSAIRLMGNLIPLRNQE